MVFIKQNNGTVLYFLEELSDMQGCLTAFYTTHDTKDGNEEQVPFSAKLTTGMFLVDSQASC